ncbi:hypothetical protein PR001_g29506 [Phytophthora rubi]|uniref:Cytosol aminopeptidase domain-containing protein n=1 Tax=Phytophthora rubi TaxID=129364 RepID=A0A6A3HAM2_9STRA|nr:hypothetical protein PR001_g29506 [Phytophthora rubi]KAE8966182.1 hypothetical protein PR002_g28446 [Phytophthora rubi]
MQGVQSVLEAVHTTAGLPCGSRAAGPHGHVVRGGRVPAIVCVSHVPEGAAKDAKGVAMVGQGIIFDTGGLSIKTGGAAALLAAFEAACHTKNTTDKTPLHVVRCVVENSVGPDSTRVDNELVMYSGKTVVDNTDAEGRLELVDGVAYAVKHLNPKGVSTGNRIGTIYTNNENLEGLAVKAGKIC